MSQNIIIRKSDNVVLASGYCDLSQNPEYNPSTMYIIENEYMFMHKHNDTLGYYSYTPSAGDFTFNETPLKTRVLAEMATETFDYVEAKMPQWRLNRWRRYYDICQKIAVSASVTELDQEEYDTFPDPGETQEQCQTYVSLALQWCLDCIAAYKLAVVAVSQATTPEEIAVARIVNYPPWIF